jgi:hypothetical protein
MLFVDLPDQQPTGFIRRASGNYHQPGVGPKHLRRFEINAVFTPVLSALVRIVFEPRRAATKMWVYLRYNYYTSRELARRLRGVRFGDLVYR